MRTGNDILSTLLRHSIGQVEIEAFTEYIYIYFTAVSLYLLLLIALRNNEKQVHTLIETKDERIRHSLKELADVNRALNESSIIAITDRKGKITFVNEKFCEISKYSRDELLHQDHRLLNSGYHPKSFFKEMWRTIGKGDVWQGEIRNLAKDGTTYWVHTTIVPFLNDSGIPYQYVSIRNDITESKLNEENLKESEERYRKVVEYSPKPIVIHVNKRIRYANPSCIRLLGAKSLEDLRYRSILEFAHPDYIELIEKRTEELTSEGLRVAPTEEKVIRLDGTIIDVEVSGITLKHDGMPAVLMMIHDITRRKRAEDTLRENEEKFRSITENMTDLVSILEPNGNIQYASPSHTYVLGIEPQSYEKTSIFQWVHPDDLFLLKEEMDQVEQNGSFEIELRILHANGKWRWIEAKGKPVLDDQKNVYYIQTEASDITERKENEQKVRHMAYHDALTNLPNRRLFDERLKAAIKIAKQKAQIAAVLYLDMDKFKSINDTLGHDIGDEVLIQFADRVSSCLREEDTLSRQGGDEFMVLLTDLKEPQDAMATAERILKALAPVWHVCGHELNISSSIGIAYYPSDSVTTEGLLKCADQALYQAKVKGRDTYCAYNEMVQADCLIEK
nr:sensor domain-containing diguanylate cyclase [Alkalihalophilus marmarensis]